MFDYKIDGEDRFISGDIKIYLMASAQGKVRGMSDYTCAYRVNYGGVSHDAKHYLPRLKKYPEQYICILENFGNVDKHVIQKYIYSYTTELYEHRDSISGKLKDVYVLVKYCPGMSIKWFRQKLGVRTKLLKILGYKND